MIGDVVALSGGGRKCLPGGYLNLPLPFFYGRDSGVALPTAALPYNEMRVTFSFRDWRDLLIEDILPAAPVAGSDVNLLGNPCTIPVPAHIGGEPVLGNVQVWANYAIVSNDERKRMACAPRDILIEQVQTAPVQTYTPGSNRNLGTRSHRGHPCLTVVQTGLPGGF